MSFAIKLNLAAKDSSDASGCLCRHISRYVHTVATVVGAYAGSTGMQMDLCIDECINICTCMHIDVCIHISTPQMMSHLYTCMHMYAEWLETTCLHVDIQRRRSVCVHARTLRHTQTCV